MTFEQCIECVLDIEQGYVFDSNDPGGETNWGISKRQYPNVDIKNLTKAEAINLYFQDYWTPLKCAQLPSRLRLCAFDASIHHGVERAIKMLQGAVGTKQDGILGPKTLEAARVADEVSSLSNFLLMRHGFVTGLPQWGTYSKGWSKRLMLMALWASK